MNKPKCCICDKEWMISTERDDDGLSYILRHPFNEDCILYGLIWTFETKSEALAAAQPKAVYRETWDMKRLLENFVHIHENYRLMWGNCNDKITVDQNVRETKELLAKLEDE